MKEQSNEEQRRHYSEKGGHKERSDFWKDVRKIPVPIEQAYLIRRQMMRNPRDGKR